MSAELPDYDEVVWEHFRTPRNIGAFPAGTPQVFEGKAGSRRLGREIQVALRIKADGRVSECRYQVFGCPATIAICSIVSERLLGRSAEELRDFSGLTLAEELGLPPAKRVAGLVLEDALKAALARYNMTSELRTA